MHNNNNWQSELTYLRTVRPGQFLRFYNDKTTTMLITYQETKNYILMFTEDHQNQYENSRSLGRSILIINILTGKPIVLIPYLPGEELLSCEGWEEILKKLPKVRTSKELFLRGRSGPKIYSMSWKLSSGKTRIKAL